MGAVLHSVRRPKSAEPRAGPPPSPTKEHSPPKVYEPRTPFMPAQHHIWSHAMAFNFVDGGAFATRQQQDLLQWFETRHQTRAAIDEARWRGVTAAQRAGCKPRVYDSAGAVTASRPASRPSSASSVSTHVRSVHNSRHVSAAGTSRHASVFPFHFLGVPEKRLPQWDTAVTRSAGGSLPQPSDSLMRR